MEIGLIHYRVGETDGVSLEMTKWKKVLEKIGFKVYLIAGDMGTSAGFKIPSISYSNTTNNFLKHKSFVDLNGWNEDQYICEMKSYTTYIYDQLKELMNLDIMIVNNIFSLAHNPAAAMAIYHFCKDRGIKIVGHHHDFYWERDYYANPTNIYIRRVLQMYFPPKDITHVVINSITQEKLKIENNLDSVVIPNVFDFNQEQWEIDDYNVKIYDKLNISKNDLIFLQATRIVKRKAIELAIDVVSEINKDLKKYVGEKTYNGKIITENTAAKLLLPGLPEDMDYLNTLIEYAKRKNVELKLASSICDNIRHESKGVFSLWDFYAIADFITYPSVLEGFGNQFLEAIFSKTPILIFEYPVYKKDIAPLGFEIVSLGNKAELKNGLYKVNQDTIIKAKDQILEILFDTHKASESVQKNFELGRKYFSYDMLEEKLRYLIE